jgi:hypothetical protein
MRQKIGAFVAAAVLGSGIVGALAGPAGASGNNNPPANGYWNGVGPGGCRPQGFNWNVLGGNPASGQWAGWGNPPGQSVSYWCAPGQQP